MSNEVQQFENDVLNYLKETTEEATNKIAQANQNSEANKNANKCNSKKIYYQSNKGNNPYNNNLTSYTNNNSNKIHLTTAKDDDSFGHNKLDKPQTSTTSPSLTSASAATATSTQQYATVNAAAAAVVAATSTANDCDKRNFDRITTKSNNQSCSFVYCRSRRQCRQCRNFAATIYENDNDAHSIFHVVVQQETSSTNRLNQLKSPIKKTKTTAAAAAATTTATSKHFPKQIFSISQRTFSNDFYRILFLLLQLSAALFSFSFNIGFTLAANTILANVVDDGVGSDRLNALSHSDLVGNGISSDGCSEYGDDSTYGHYTHTWAVHIPNGEQSDLADKVARDHGFVNMGKIFDDHFHFVHHKVSKRSLSSADAHQSRLDDDHRVHWAKQQRAKSRQKRDFMRMRPSRTSPRALSLVDAVILNDPKWSQMWYLNRGGGLDMNVIPAWKEGITGKGVVVTILDDGLESDHPDIEHNYDPLASYDVNSHDNDPMPHYDMTDSNRHGTRCAGEVAATANNTICAVGIAFGASVGGVRMLDGDVTDAVEARSLSLNPQHIDIYSASWGPDDDGKTVDGPGELASRAFIEGVTKGRGGKGSIFIWASGNGGRELDNCNCDGYTNSIWTLSISSATEDGHVPWYSEKCSSTLATTYSSGSQGEKQVVTTDLHHSCTVSHTGTSASAPLAAGIAALVLESNRNLTWRDLQHIVVRTAKPANLKDPTWSKNGVGRRISHSFGYGLMDAAAMVRVARTWKTVPEQQRCEINAPHVDKTIPAEGYITLQLAVKHCMSVNYLEHVQAKITLTSQRRGDIQLYLRSPAGTKVTLLTNRLHDNSRTGFNQWPFMSVHTWGESPHGNWQLEIHNEGRFKGHALLREWSLIFYGTTQPIDPNDPISIRRTTVMEITTPNSPSTISSGGGTTTTLHQVYSPLYPRISPSNMATGNGIAKYPAKLPPNKSSYVVNNGGAGIVGASNGNGNRKQQQQQQQQGYQQISATYGVILGSQHKNTKGNKMTGVGVDGGGGGGGNNKGGKGKSGENKKNSNKNNGSGGNGGGSGGGGGSKSSLTGNAGNGGNKKNQSIMSSPNAQKMKFYRILQELQASNGGNSGNSGGSSSNNNNKSKTKSPSNKQNKQQSVERIQLYTSEEKINRNKQVIGDLPSKIPLRGGATVTATTTTSLQQTQTKLPNKSTKQVKEKSTMPKTHEKLVAAPSAIVTATPAIAGNIAEHRIPKMFERYDKIQAIFPEFQPYQGTLKEQENNTISNSNTNQRQANKSKEKVERMPTQTPPQAPPLMVSPISYAGTKPSRENSKKSSQSFIPDPVIIRKQQQLLIAAAAAASSVNSALRDELSAENENAQITQWDLIFYGTDVPAQPEDVVQFSSGKDNSLGIEMDHNDIEFDASGQWHNLQQIGVVKSHDRTNTACIKTTIDQKCLACAPPTLLFNDRCYDECPRHTFAMVSTSLESENQIEITDNANGKLNDLDEQLISVDKRSQRREIMTETPAASHVENATNKMELRRCHICDSSCYDCYGPSDSQCSTCYVGGRLRTIHNGTFCYNFAERSTKNGGENSHFFEINTSQVTKLKLILIVAVLIAFAVFIAISIVYRERLSQSFRNLNGSKVHYTYDRVALLNDNETEELSKCNTADSDWESEEEIDVFNIPNEKT